ncbi:MAG TPA: 50S ribosomal protein L13, partial [Candidatus Gracilibacteria bacterium]|nr:50S ribosomal protein L13 [Candidatus Gracilibacteria bacterium]
MKTFSPKISEMKRQWFLVDVKDKTLGKVATRLADILRGKNKPTFSPHLDCGDYVVVINAKEIGLSGSKLLQKEYHHHSRYPGGLKTFRAEELLEKNPERVLESAIAGMIPHTKIKKDILKKLKIFPGSEHEH